MSRRLSIDEAERGLAAGDRGVLARAITLIESLREDDRLGAEDLVSRVLPRTGRAVRVGLSGVPGVGKSTFIEALGMHLVESGKSVAVLAVDPSSAATGGSILGDKTRMPRLAAEPRAFIRPSPAGGELGGVARRTREAMLLCEAFGFDVVLVETVGVGQSEAVVAEMVDCFVLLALPGAGDELQGLKRGVMELVDVVAVNKADGDNLIRAKRAVRDIKAALQYQRRRLHAWEPRVLPVSALTGSGVVDLWATVEEHRAAIAASGELESIRRSQTKRWLWSLVKEGVMAAFRETPEVAARLSQIEAAVEAGALTAPRGARELLEAFRARLK
ncbi:MAG: methylmalonyl Co-A mutase-associated GTPase MeaB [Myxococcales bacterium]|nr:methylmalonyl Co-A mutase-associated GTPase MeaB [Myxococcales bacterium]